MVKNNINPHHIGIIMDGNGRWVKANGQPRIVGHKKGVKAVRNIVKACIDSRIRVLTLYVFSTENWQRPPEEVSYLMKLIENFTLNDRHELLKNGVRLQIMGQRQKLPATLLGTLDEVVAETQGNNKLILNLALNYGGRTEIVDAVKSIIQDYENGIINREKNNQKNFSRYLYCPEVPDVDLTIRTSGELRLSNFMLWHSVNVIFWSTPVHWPDFQDKNLLEAIEFYQDQLKIERDK